MKCRIRVGEMFHCGARPLGVVGATAAQFSPPPVNLEVKLRDSNGVFVRAKDDGMADAGRRSNRCT